MASTGTKATFAKHIFPPDKLAVTMIVNGAKKQVKVAPWTTLLDALRDHLDLTGTKRDAITVNAAPARSWSTDDG